MRGAWLLLLVLLAGCMDDPAADPTSQGSATAAPDDQPDPAPGEPEQGPSEPTPEPRPPRALSFDAHADVTTTGNGAEPGIAVAPDGTLYANVWRTVARSDDGGGSWTALETPLETNGDSDLAVDADGTLHLVGMSLVNQEGPRLPYARSTDGGETWSDLVDLGDGRDVDRPWIATGPGDRLLLVWNDFPEKQMALRTSTDGGATWSDVTYLEGGWFPLVGQPVHADGAFVFAALSVQAEARVHVQNGTGWDLVSGPGAEWAAFFPTLVRDDAGTWHLVGTLHGEDALEVAHWSAPDPTGPWIASPRVSGDGEALMGWAVPRSIGVAVAYYQSRPAEGGGLLDGLLGGADDGPEWIVEVAEPFEGDWQRLQASEGVVHRGTFCHRFASCTEGAAPFFDYFEAAPAAGGVAVVHVVHADQHPSGQHAVASAVG